MKPRNRLLPVIAPVGTTALIVGLLLLKPATDPTLEAGVARAGSAQGEAGNVATTGVPVPGTTSSAASPTASVSRPATATRSVSRSKAAAGTITTSKPAATTARPTTASATTSTASTKTSTTLTFTGATISTKYGPVQVRITVKSGRIASSSAIQYPNETARSRELSGKAIPILNDEAVAAQSAGIDSVSGATYTSSGYKQSLQSAIDRAGL